MTEHERRRRKRKTEVVPVSVVTTETLRLEGHTVDVSSGGIFFTAPEIQLVVSIRGKTYHGRLVRALPNEDGMTGYAVELGELVRPVDTPETAFAPAQA